MKRVQQKVHSAFSPRRQRMFLIAAGIALQFAIYVVLLVLFSQYFVYFYWICVLVSLVMALFISTWKSKLAYKIAWIIPILLVPLIGGVMFIILGGARDPHYHREETRRTLKRQLPSRLSTTDLMRYGPDAMQQAWYLGHAALCPAYTNTETAYFSSGASFFPNFLEELEQAKDYIFLEYFIIDEGLMWGRILEVLARKAAGGVDVRVMYDGTCEFSTLPRDYPKRLEALGIRCKVFAPVTPFVSTHYNYRDHRKILVIDGRVGFTGGVNLADEYINHVEKYGRWKDAAVMLEGEGVRSMTALFLQMWSVLQEPEFEQFLRPEVPAARAEGFVVPYGDCPLDGERVGEMVYIDLLNRARKYVHIITPYLILDGELETALRFAAERGVDVHLILPGVPDKQFAYALAKTHYKALLSSGVKISEWTPGFTHAKLVVMDGVEAVVGTINLDYRSLYHHFENAVWMRRVGSIRDMETDFQDTLARCRTVEATLQSVWQGKKLLRLMGLLLKVIAPLM